MRMFRWYAEYLPNPFSKTSGIHSRVGYVYGPRGQCVEVRWSSEGHFNTRVNWEYLRLEGEMLWVLQVVARLLQSDFGVMGFDARMEALAERGYVKKGSFFVLEV